MRILRNWEECCGDLVGLSADECGLIASIGSLNISLPIDLLPVLRPHIGCRIGILRTDITAKEYLFRVISEKSFSGNEDTKADSRDEVRKQEFLEDEEARRHG
jgi:hypothetical protein